MKAFLHLALLALLLSVFMPQALWAAEPRRMLCGEYSFELPQGFELREIIIDADKYEKTLTLNLPFNQKDLSNATLTCVREKKTDQQSFSLPYKEKIHFRIAARRSTLLLISATENARLNNMWMKFSLLEERISNARVIQGRERFLVAIEMDALSEDWHTMLFVSDFSKFDGFFDADEYKSQVTGTAIQVMDSIKKELP